MWTFIEFVPSRQASRIKPYKMRSESLLLFILAAWDKMKAQLMLVMGSLGVRFFLKDLGVTDFVQIDTKRAAETDG